METVNITFLWTLGAVIQKLTEQVGKSLSNHGNKNKPAGGVNVAQAFIKKEEVQELKVSLLIAIVISLSNWTRYMSFFFFMLKLSWCIEELKDGFGVIAL